MLKYKNIATVVLSVDLHNNYSVIAIGDWHKEEKNYTVSLFIKANDIDLLDKIEKQDNVVFASDMKSIRTDIAKYITDLHDSKFFDYYVNRYNYEMKCFDIGNEELEKQIKSFEHEMNFC